MREMLYIGTMFNAKLTAESFSITDVQKSVLLLVGITGRVDKVPVKAAK